MKQTPMAVSNIRKRLITYLADADEKRVKAIYSLFEEDIKRDEAFKLTGEHLKILKQRRTGHRSGKDKSSTWQEVHDRVVRKRTN